MLRALGNCLLLGLGVTNRGPARVGFKPTSKHFVSPTTLSTAQKATWQEAWHPDIAPITKYQNLPRTFGPLSKS